MKVVRFPTLRSLSEPAELARLFGSLARVERVSPIQGGYSGSTLQRLTVVLENGERRSQVLKLVRLDEDWTAYRTGDTFGREAAMLGNADFAGIWDVFRCPYRAYAIEPGAIGLLMDDLDAHLLPDGDAPLAAAQEDALLEAFARLHARYWESPALRSPLLVRTSQRFAVLGPRLGEEEASRNSSPALFQLAREGWSQALGRLPDSVRDLLLQPAESLADQFQDLPLTLIHGDGKVANFALFPGGEVAAFDWEFIGAGPPTFDLGWYLAVNSSRLARPKEEFIRRYRDLLQTVLGRTLPPELWVRMLRVGILCGALMLLWSKALALQDESSESTAEWNWWVEQLKR